MPRVEGGMYRMLMTAIMLAHLGGAGALGGIGNSQTISPVAAFGGTPMAVQPYTAPKVRFGW